MTGTTDLAALRRHQQEVARQIAAAFGVPDHLLGLRTGPVRRWWQRHITRRPDREPFDFPSGRWWYRRLRWVRNAHRALACTLVPSIAGTLLAAAVGMAVGLALVLAVKGWL